MATLVRRTPEQIEEILRLPRVEQDRIAAENIRQIITDPEARDQLIEMLLPALTKSISRKLMAGSS
jgi:hypothetical protein